MDLKDVQYKRLKEFLEDILHGPCGSVEYKEYEQYVSEEARVLLKEVFGDEGES